MKGDKVVLIVLAILFTLFLRDLPYFNVAIIGKMWIVYLILFSAILLSHIRLKSSTIFYLMVFLLGVALVLTFLYLNFFAEIIGVVLFCFMWIFLGKEIWFFIKKRA